jgi:uncharacterized membrane protein YdbT with pleckstrin-like domain
MPSFIEKNLANNEKIVYRAKLHWAIYLKGILMAIIGIACAIIAKSLVPLIVFGGFLLLCGLVSLISAYTRSSSSEFVVTNRRIMLKTGVLKRHFIELQLNRADGLSVDQGIMGRIMDYGSIIVVSGGSREVFSPIAGPYEFKKQINNAIEGSFAPIQNPSMI